MFLKKHLALFICLSVVIFNQTSFAKTLVFSSPQGGDFKIGFNAQESIQTKKLRGSNIILLFGYTQCKSVCPFSLRNIKSALDQMSLESKRNIKVVFISVDNERDQFQKIKEFLKPFGSEFIGTSGKDSDLKKILARFGARHYRFKTEN